MNYIHLLAGLQNKFGRGLRVHWNYTSNTVVYDWLRWWQGVFTCSHPRVSNFPGDTPKKGQLKIIEILKIDRYCPTDGLYRGY